MAASWALLEHLIIEITATLAEHHGYTIPKDFVKGNSLDKTLSEFKAVIKLIENPEGRTFLESILKRTQNLKPRRHLLIHGISTWDPKDPAKIKINTPKKKDRPQAIDAKKIDEIARQIAEVNFELIYPQGKSQFYEDKVRVGHSMSRRYAISTTGTISNDPTLNLFPLKSKSIHK